MVIREYDIQSILPKIGGIKKKRTLKANGQKYKISMGIRRLQLIAKTQVCSCCGLQGAFFKLELKKDSYPHLNMYGLGLRKNHIRFTLDHILPKSKGGTTRWENIQLLCERCNTAKGADIMTLEELRKRVFPDNPK